MSDTAPSPARIAPLALWRVAQAFLHTLYNLFGAPEDVAREHTFTAKAHEQLASWLRCAEAMLRRLLLIEASAYPKPNTRLASPERSEGGPPLRAPRQRVRKLMLFDADKPEEWRVCFRVFASPTLRQPRTKSGGDAGVGAAGSVSVSLSLSKAKRPEPQRFRSAWPLAERYEALLRVYNDPTKYAQRLARRLHAAPRLLTTALRAPPEAVHRVDDFDVMAHHAETAWRPHFSSG
jgi:hypothetical protein